MDSLWKVVRLTVALMGLAGFAPAQDAYCHGPVEHHVCEFSNGDVIESTLSADGTFSERHYSKGKSLDLGDKKTWDDIIAREDAGETKARHELCATGIIKGYRCHDVPGVPIVPEKKETKDDFHDCFMSADAKNINRCNSDPDYRKTMAEKYRAEKARKAAAAE
jgi:hypothetical protein